jgi:hypothetical protein
MLKIVSRMLKIVSRLLKIVSRLLKIVLRMLKIVSRMLKIVSRLLKIVSRLLKIILRLDVDKTEVVNDHIQFYSVPQDNPFVGNQSYRPEIFALGARNMWRCSVDKGIYFHKL